MAITLLNSPATVSFDRILKEIEKFNRMGRNPFGPNVPVKTHRALLFCIEGRGINVEFEFYARDRSEEAVEFLNANPAFNTRHAIIYPMTRALIQRQWHRVYAFDVRMEAVVGVKLLVGKRQDPELFIKHPDASAYPWINAAKNCVEPIALD